MAKGDQPAIAGVGGSGYGYEANEVPEVERKEFLTKVWVDDDILHAIFKCRTNNAPSENLLAVSEIDSHRTNRSLGFAFDVATRVCGLQARGRKSAKKKLRDFYHHTDGHRLSLFRAVLIISRRKSKVWLFESAMIPSTICVLVWYHFPEVLRRKLYGQHVQVYVHSVCLLK